MKKNNVKQMLNQFVPAYLILATSTGLMIRPSKTDNSPEYLTDTPSGYLIGRDGNKTGEFHSGDVYTLDPKSRTGIKLSQDNFENAINVMMEKYEVNEK